MQSSSPQRRIGTLDDYCKKRADILEILCTKLNSRAVNDKPAKKSNFVVYSDASASRCSAHLDLNGEQACHKLWEVSERKKSSTWRDLSPIDYALKVIPAYYQRVVLEMVFRQPDSRQNYSSRKHEIGAPRFSN